MIITYQKRCKGWHDKWVSEGDTLDVTRSAAREEIARGVALPDKDSDLHPTHTIQEEIEDDADELEDKEI